MSPVQLFFAAAALVFSASRHAPGTKDVSVLRPVEQHDATLPSGVVLERGVSNPAPTDSARTPRQLLYGHNGPYLQFGAGLTTTQSSEGPGEEIDFDEGFAIPLAFGYRFGAEDTNAISFDLELEALYTDQDADDQGTLQAVNDVTAIAGLVNGVADFALGQTFSVYGGAGIGVAGLDVGTQSDSLNSFSEEDGPFLAWQAKAGVRWWASQRISWSLGYRFLNIDDAEIDDEIGAASFDLQTEQHIVELGLRFGL